MKDRADDFFRNGRKILWRRWKEVSPIVPCCAPTVLCLTSCSENAKAVRDVFLPQMDQAIWPFLPPLCTHAHPILSNSWRPPATPPPLTNHYPPLHDPRVLIEGHSATSWGNRELLEPLQSCSCWSCVIISRQTAVRLLQHPGSVGNAEDCPVGEVFWMVDTGENSEK
jgi:hypothetical protein